MLNNIIKPLILDYVKDSLNTLSHHLLASMEFPLLSVLLRRERAGERERDEGAMWGHKASSIEMRKAHYFRQIGYASQAKWEARPNQ